MASNKNKHEIINKLRSLGLSVSMLSEMTGKARLTIYRYIEMYCNGETINDIQFSKLIEIVDTNYGSMSKEKIISEISKIYTIPFHSNRTITSKDYRLDNMHANYVNISALTPEDRMMNGSFVIDRSNEVSKEDQEDVFRRLDTYRYLCEEAKTLTRTKIEGKQAWFSDSQNTFIAHYKHPIIRDDILNDYIMARHRLEYVRRILENELFTLCPLEHVYSLLEYVNEAINAINEIEHFEDRYDCDKLDAKVKELNEKRNMESINKHIWYLSYGFYEVNDGTHTVIKEFNIIHNTTYRETKSEIHHFLKEHDNAKLICCMTFGQFNNREETNKILSYLEVEYEDLVIPENLDEKKSTLINWIKTMAVKKKLRGTGDPDISQ